MDTILKGYQWLSYMGNYFSRRKHSPRLNRLPGYHQKIYVLMNNKFFLILGGGLFE